MSKVQKFNNYIGFTASIPKYCTKSSQRQVKVLKTNIMDSYQDKSYNKDIVTPKSQVLFSYVDSY